MQIDRHSRSKQVASFQIHSRLLFKRSEARILLERQGTWRKFTRQKNKSEKQRTVSAKKQLSFGFNLGADFVEAPPAGFTTGLNVWSC